MSQLIEMTAQYLENVCRIGAYAQADREWRQQQQLRSRPSSVCGGGAYASIDSAKMTRNDDMLAKKYRMQVKLREELSLPRVGCLPMKKIYQSYTA